MQIKDIVNLITDTKIDIELIEELSGASFGFYNKNYVPHEEKEVKNINVQYINGKRILVIKF